MSTKPPLPKKRAAPGCPGWMMTFGDCMSLLVTFFVMLIAFSSLEEAKLAALAGVLRGAFGAVEMRSYHGAVERESISDVDRARDTELEHNLRGEEENVRFLTPEEMADAVPDFINEIRPNASEVVADRILIQMLDEGLSIVLQTTDLFEEGSTRWRQSFDALWQGISGLLMGRNNQIRVTSITGANAAVQRDVASTSWGLGIARADVIAHELQKALGSKPNRFALGVQLYEDHQGTIHDDHVQIMILDQNHKLELGNQQDLPKGVWR
jgi:chemotaxis protein MotB